MMTTFGAITARLRAYESTPLVRDIFDGDGMFVRGAPGAVEEYFQVGRSALELLIRAMLAVGRAEIGSILDLPCGAGRVTRHLAACFPEANLFVAELDKPCERFVVDTFKATAIDVAVDFSSSPEQQFDLIFVGSLLTHLEAPLFIRALEWFINATAPDGLLVVTTHGRRADHVERTLHRHIDPRAWRAAGESCATNGFGYVETERFGPLSYGYSLCAPSWLMRLVEKSPAVEIVGFQEAAWNAHQDALTLRKRAG